MTRAIYQALKDMFEYFDKPNERASPTMIEMYLLHLEKFPEPAVLAAIDQAIGTCTFRPKIAEIADIIANAAAGPDDLAETAWTEVQREIKRVGYQPNRIFHNGDWYDPPKPKFSNERIAEAVESIGWKTICHGELDESRTAFIFTYRNLRKRDTAKIQRGELGTDPALPSASVRALGKGAA